MRSERRAGSARAGRCRLLHYPADAQPKARVGRFPLHVRTHLGAVAVPVQENTQLTRFLGAVYTEDGNLVGESQRAKPGRKYHRNPPHLAALPADDAERLAGRTFFAGQLAYQFGHVLLESLTRFWPMLDYPAYDHFVVYPNRQRTGAVEVPELMREVLALADVPPDRIRVVTDRPLLFESLDVSTAPIRVGSAADSRLMDVFDRVASRVVAERPPARGGTSSRLYLSRSRLTEGRRALNEAWIERLFTEHGFEVVHTQELGVRDQVARVRDADVLAGCDGSALHLAAFARPGTRLLALDTRRTPNQFLIDTCRGLDATHAWVLTEPLGDRRSTFSADPARVEEALAGLLSDEAPRPVEPPLVIGG